MKDMSDKDAGGRLGEGEVPGETSSSFKINYKSL